MKKHILLIEDDYAIIDVYKTVFEKAGFSMETISLGRDALDKVKQIKEGKAEKPDIILLDLILPDINGMEILEYVRAQEETKGLLLYILSNYTDKELEKMGYNIKSEKFLLKTDYKPSELVKVIKEGVGIK